MTSPGPETKSSGELEREVEQTRARVAETLEELRERISPGQLVDQLVDYARVSGGGEFARNLGRAIRDNPIPVALIGAGIGWLMMSGGRSQPRVSYQRGDGYDQDEGYIMTQNRSYGTTQPVGSEDPAFSPASSDIPGSRSSYLEEDSASTHSGGTGRKASGAKSTSRAAADTASSTYRGVTHAASRAASALGDVASSVRSTASDTAYRAGSSGYYVVRRARRGLFDLVEEQPLLLGVIGFAVGAAIGAAMPTTSLENRYLGETSDELKRRAQELGEEQYEKAKAIAARAYQEALQEAEAQGLTPGAARERAAQAVRGLGDKLESVAEAAKEGAEEEARNRKLGGTAT